MFANLAKEILRPWFHVVGMLPPWGWGVVISAAVAGCGLGWTWATGWGEVGRWEITLISIASFLGAGITTIALAGGVIWTGAAYLSYSYLCGSSQAAAAWSAAALRGALPLGLGLAAGLIFSVWQWHAARTQLQPDLCRRLGIITHSGDVLTDARSIEQHLPEPISYNPLKYHVKAKERGRMFLGLDETGKPFFINRSIWLKSHVQDMGPTGTGKGVEASNMLVQSIAYDDAVYVIDPKDDEWAPSVLKEACERQGVPFRLVSLRRQHGPQLNMIDGITPVDLNALFIAGFSLGMKGRDSDHYKKGDRAASLRLSKAVAKKA